MKKTRKVLAVVLAFVLTVSLSVAGTIAYLADTDSAKNTFTTGNVKIDLTEADVVEDTNGNLVANGTIRNDVLDAEEAAYDYGKIYPGQTIYKDPTIELLAGSENAYLGAVVTVSVGKGADGKGVDVEDILDKAVFATIIDLYSSKMMDNEYSVADLVRNHLFHLLAQTESNNKCTT